MDSRALGDSERGGNNECADGDSERGGNNECVDGDSERGGNNNGSARGGNGDGNVPDSTGGKESTPRLESTSENAQHTGKQEPVSGTHSLSPPNTNGPCDAPDRVGGKHGVTQHTGDSGPTTECDNGAANKPPANIPCHSPISTGAVPAVRNLAPVPAPNPIPIAAPITAPKPAPIAAPVATDAVSIVQAPIPNTGNAISDTQSVVPNTDNAITSTQPPDPIAIKCAKVHPDNATALETNKDEYATASNTDTGDNATPSAINTRDEEAVPPNDIAKHVRAAQFSATATGAPGTPDTGGGDVKSKIEAYEKSTQRVTQNLPGVTHLSPQCVRDAFAVLWRPVDERILKRFMDAMENVPVDNAFQRIAEYLDQKAEISMMDIVVSVMIMNEGKFYMKQVHEDTGKISLAEI